MILRSSSTPILGSLLSSFSESPQKHPTPNVHQNSTKLSCNNGGFQNVAKSLLNSPFVTQNGIRRVQSEGNLEELGNASYNVDDFSLSNQYSKKFTHKPKCCTLEAIPSFSHLNLETGSEDYDGEEEEEEENYNPFRVQNLVSEEERTNVNGYRYMGFQGEGKMYLATGIGVQAIGLFYDGGDGGCGGGGGSYRPVDFSRDGGDSRGLSMEEYYKNMLEENPGNSLVLRNYAQFLYQKKGDLEGAEEYYSRAILADPEDGEILCQYAKLIWELHHDKERAAAYFERAVQASSEDSHTYIHASYAGFLWDIEDDEDDDKANAAENSHLGPPLFHHGVMASATASCCSVGKQDLSSRHEKGRGGCMVPCNF